MQDTKSFEYSFLIENNVLLTHHEIERIAYKTTLNKISKYTKYTNQIMRKLIDDALKQI